MGFITVEAFNAFAPIAQTNIYNEMFVDLVEASKARKSNIDPGRDKSLSKQVHEDLAYFLIEQELEDIDTIQEFSDSVSDGVSVVALNEGGSRVFRKPFDLSKIVSMRTSANYTNNIEVLYDASKLNSILGSNLSAPTESYPLAVVSNKIQVFPQSLDDKIYITYYRQPRSVLPVNIVGQGRVGDTDFSSLPRFSALSVSDQNGYVVPNINGCRDFELPEHYKNQLLMELTKMVGISLRDNILSTFSITEEQAE